jgi:hypothetical protein
MVSTQNNISTDFIFAMRILIPFLVVIGLLSRQRPLLDFWQTRVSHLVNNCRRRLASPLL